MAHLLELDLAAASGVAEAPLLPAAVRNLHGPGYSSAGSDLSRSTNVGTIGETLEVVNMMDGNKNVVRPRDQVEGCTSGWA